MEWIIENAPVDYAHAVSFMERRVQAIRAGLEDEAVWLLEHPPLYTAGSGAKDDDLLDALGFPVYKTGRGGQYTYHGPGQRIAYVMLDLKKRAPDVRLFVQKLEAWIIDTLSAFGVEGHIREGRVGVWVEGGSAAKARDYKIAALGIRIRQWVTYHGVAVNVHPDLSHYRGIIPCGITEHGVTSLAALGKSITLPQFDRALIKSFGTIF